jgi:hypothetical protein
MQNLRLIEKIENSKKSLDRFFNIAIIAASIFLAPKILDPIVSLLGGVMKIRICRREAS